MTNAAATNWNLAEYQTDPASFTPCPLSLDEQIEDAYASLDAAWDALRDGWGTQASVNRHLANVRSLLKQQRQPLPLRTAMA